MSVDFLSSPAGDYWDSTVVCTIKSGSAVTGLPSLLLMMMVAGNTYADCGAFIKADMSRMYVHSMYIV